MVAGLRGDDPPVERYARQKGCAEDRVILWRCQQGGYQGAETLGAHIEMGIAHPPSVVEIDDVD